MVPAAPLRAAPSGSVDTRRIRAYLRSLRYTQNLVEYIKEAEAAGSGAPRRDACARATTNAWRVLQHSLAELVDAVVVATRELRERQEAIRNVRDQYAAVQQAVAMRIRLFCGEVPPEHHHRIAKLAERLSRALEKAIDVTDAAVTKLVDQYRTVMHRQRLAGAAVHRRVSGAKRRRTSGHRVAAPARRADTEHAATLGHYRKIRLRVEHLRNMLARVNTESTAHARGVKKHARRMTDFRGRLEALEAQMAAFVAEITDTAGGHAASGAQYRDAVARRRAVARPLHNPLHPNAPLADWAPGAGQPRGGAVAAGADGGE